MNNSRSNGKRFVYFYFNRKEAEKIRQVIPAHVGYWKKANVEGYMGGPFGDRTGGLISFSVSSLEKATEIVLQDPFIQEDLIDQKWIKEWVQE